jgi:hypothetical protein
MPRPDPARPRAGSGPVSRDRDNVSVWPDTHAEQIKAAYAIAGLFDAAETRGDAVNVRLLALAEDLDVLRADAERFARHSLNGELAAVRPTLRLISHRYDHFIVMGNIPPTRRGQIETSTTLGVLFALPWIKAYWFAHEVWRATIDAMTITDLRDKLPSDRPDRTEGLVIVIATRAGDHAVRSYATERGEVVGIRYERDLTTISNPVLKNLFGLRDAVIRLADQRANRP